MSNKNSFIFAGASAAVVAILGIGGYFLHKKFLKCRLQELTERQAMSLALYGLANADDMAEDEDYYEDYDYDDDFFENLDTEGKMNER